MTNITFEYNPVFQTIVKLQNNKIIDSLQVPESDLCSLSQILCQYLKGKKFTIEVQTEDGETEV